jgi:stage II sporulation protein D
MGLIRRWRCLLFGAALLWLGSLGIVGCGQKAPPTGVATIATPVVRVRLLADTSKVTLSATGSPVIHTAAGAAQHVDLPSRPAVPLTLDAAGWKIGSMVLPPVELTIEPDQEGVLSVNGQRYRGSFHFIPATSSTFDVVNHVDVDAYLKGVLAKEMMPDFGAEAYKAQAIVARTYALYESRTAPPGRPWDLYPDTRSQVYGGITAETAKSRSAVDETSGVVVAFGPPGQERIFKAYFSSCCGGAGQSAAQAFGEPDIEPLADQAVGQRCAESPRFNWGPLVISKQELTRRFRAYGQARNRPEKNIATIRQIDITSRNASGRPVQFTVIDTRGQRYLLTGEQLRWAVNSGASEPGASGVTLPSSFVKPVADANNIRFEDGHGFGHGVGLCQWCAQAESERGVPHEQIVLSAYRGARLVRAY